MLLPIAFKADEDYNGDVPKRKVPSHYRDYANKCVSYANKRMFLPDGTKMKIVLQTPQEESCSAHVQTIRIGSNSHRHEYTKYGHNIDCGALTHELLHLTGMVDSYPVETAGFIVNAQTNRIVRDVILSPDQTVTVSNPKYKFIREHDCRVIRKHDFMGKTYDKWMDVFTDKQQSKSLITPEQFNVIVYGGCAVNSPYNECAALAYKTSTEYPNCLEKKKQCEAKASSI